jgi:hypothetical protein
MGFNNTYRNYLSNQVTTRNYLTTLAVPNAAVTIHRQKGDSLT